MLQRLTSLPCAAVLALATTAPRTGAADSLAPGPPSDNFTIADFANGSTSIPLSGLTDFRWLPDGRVVMTIKDGRTVVRLNNGSLSAAGTFQVATQSEQGLLGVEVDPAFASNRRLFFYYSAAASIGGTDLDRNRVASVLLGDDSTLDMSSHKVLLQGLRGPANHDGGALSIGTDGKLYVGVGDTGCNSGVPPGGSISNYFATCLTNGNGKILRVDLDGTIPMDNPLAGVPSATACGSTCGTDIATTGTSPPRAEIWAWGLRNPWRIWTDPLTGRLWVGDVGEVSYEEISIVPKGRHMGWPWREGAHGYPRSKCQAVAPNTGDCVDPVYDCKHGSGMAGVDGDCQSITGGQIVDSCDWPASFRGRYFFGDNAKGSLWTLDVPPSRDGVVASSRADFGTVSGAVSIRTGPDGALYVASFQGRLVRIAPSAPVPCGTPDAGEGGLPDASDASDATGVPDASDATGAPDDGLATPEAGAETGDADTSPEPAGDGDAALADGSVETATAHDAAPEASARDGEGGSAGAREAGEGEAATGPPGVGPPSDEGGCGCATPGSAMPGAHAWLASLAAATAIARRTRRRCVRSRRAWEPRG
jgi:MYXO-CTERM domain-containing protein